MKQFSFEKRKSPVDLPNFVDMQRESYDKFLQRDVPVNERAWVGIHGAFLDVFGIVGRNTVFVESLPETPRERRTAVTLIARTVNRNVKDVERITNLLPAMVLDDVSDEEAKSIRESLTKAGVGVRVTPQGISNNDGSLILQYNGYKLLPPRYPAHDDREAALQSVLSPQQRMVYASKSSKLIGRTYDSRLVVNFRLIKKRKNGEPTIIDEEVYLADIPLMTPTCSFIVNGAERVIITQIHRSAGVIFEEDEDLDFSQYGKRLFRASIIPYRGAWLEFVFDSDNCLYAVIDKRRKIYVTTFLRALGLSTEEIINVLCIVQTVSVTDIPTLPKSPGVERHPRLAQQIIDTETGEIVAEAFAELTSDLAERLMALKVSKVRIIANTDKNIAMVKTLKEDKTLTYQDAVQFIYKVLQPHFMIDFKVAKNYLDGLLFSPRRYDLSKIGRYKMNRKLKSVFAELAALQLDDVEFKEPSENTRTVTVVDILATIRYLICMNNGDTFEDGSSPQVDDIDHLGNRHIRPVGEQLENQFRLGLVSMTRLTREQMNNAEPASVTPKTILNTSPLVSAIKKFFATSELSQFLDQTNLLCELTSKRRLSALGPGGLSRRHAGFEVRDVHYTHFGRICPIETPEGANIGLITSLALYARVNKYGIIETPYRVVRNATLTNEIKYLTADQEDDVVIAPADVPLEGNRIKEDSVLGRVNGEIKYVKAKDIAYIDISPQQILSVSAALIPFLEHDDSNRALMGANMQRQAVPLLLPERPLVATGIENKIARDMGGVITSTSDGEVLFADAAQVVVLTESGKLETYDLQKYQRSNQDTCISYVTRVSRGQKVRAGSVLADSLSTCDGQLALGRNILVGFMSYEGYNFEDAILVSEKLVREDVFSSVTITEFETDARETKLGPEEITRDVPGLSEESLRNLDSDGIIRVGTEVKTDDVLVGKVTPVGEQIVTVEEKLLQAIFGKKLEGGKDASLVVPPGVRGKVIWRQMLARAPKLTKAEKKKFNDELKGKYAQIREKLEEEQRHVVEVVDGRRQAKAVEKYYEQLWQEYERLREQEKEKHEQGDELPLTVIKSVKIYIASLRKVQVGDKLSGRHGNKGIVAKIMPIEDMPFLPDGTPLDIVLSPLGVPSRMNVGQLMETVLGWAGWVLNTQFITPPFDGASEEEITQKVREAKEHLKKTGMPDEYLPDDNGKITLYDGRTGEPFMEKVLVGNMYMMKLVHMVEDKIHARSTGPYSLVTKQPLGGKAHFGGQRFGEMEVWALEGYGAAYTLQEFLTIKSDDVDGRRKVYEAIIKGEPITHIGVPESFKVLIKELQALALNIELLGNSRKSRERAGRTNELKNKMLRGLD